MYVQFKNRDELIETTNWDDCFYYTWKERNYNYTRMDLSNSIVKNIINWIYKFTKKKDKMSNDYRNFRLQKIIGNIGLRIVI